jgi:hypothetical protein
VIAFVDDGGERKGRFQRRFVERREHPPRVGGFELRDGVAPVVGFAEIQPAQVVVEDAVVADGDLGVSGGDR